MTCNKGGNLAACSFTLQNKIFAFFSFSGFDALRRKRRSEVSSRPLFDSKRKPDAKTEKVKELLGKRKQMQFSHFTSPPKTKSDLTKLGIKVRKNRSRNSEGSDNSTDKDPSVDEGSHETDAISSQTKTTSGELDSQEDGELTTKTTSYTEVRLTNPEVTSQTGTREQINDRLENEREHNTSISSITNHNSQGANCDNLKVSSNRSVTSLVSCDYADSSDASDDLT